MKDEWWDYIHRDYGVDGEEDVVVVVDGRKMKKDSGARKQGEMRREGKGSEGKKRMGNERGGEWGGGGGEGLRRTELRRGGEEEFGSRKTQGT